jgi:hypothetical protein
MAKKETVAEAAPKAESIPLSLNEFCIRLSKTEKRVELIGAFEHSERVAGRVKDTTENYAARYDQFLKKPA